ncbi:MAG: phosphoribosylformylglycinamidine cyclo-ligase [candidate division Zixibacteria bacterium]|nr:phosphoribosylformylglycinamidine cyclo-ligase [candidate division Zixibacteria bacterium]
MTYSLAGVDIKAGERAVDLIREHARSTFGPETLSEIGSFGALFAPDLTGISEPVLVSSADGVGTKLKLASMTGVHDTVGADLVNHCIDDIITTGARPLFMLDYISTGALSPEIVGEIVKGMVGACRESGVSLIGGETAEMPGFYSPGDYDLAGFIVGVVDRTNIVTGENIQPGDKLIGLKSNGLHTNGYTLARRVLFDHAKLEPSTNVDELGCNVGEALMRVHISYAGVVKAAVNVLGKDLKGMAHITGGGIRGNLSRIIPDGMVAHVNPSAWTAPPIFSFIQNKGDIAEAEMYRAFNMGIGYIIVVSEEKATDILKLEGAREHGATIIGEVRNLAGTKSVDSAPQNAKASVSKVSILNIDN